MTIFNSSLCFQGYTLRAIQPALAERLMALASKDKTSLNSCVLRLECYLQITNQKLNLLELTRVSGFKKLQGFVAAMYSDRFSRVDSNPWTTLLNFRKAITSISGDSTRFPDVPILTSTSKLDDDFVSTLTEFENRKLNQDRVVFWKGWISKNLYDEQTHFPLWRMHERYGHKHTSDFYSVCNDWFRSRRSQRVPLVAEFANYLADRETLTDFQCSSSVGNLFQDFFIHIIDVSYASENKLSSALTIWRVFSDFLDAHVFEKLWAAPLPALPKPPVKKLLGSETNITKTNKGVDVKHTLITRVPLEVTDSQAKELLFKDISGEADTLMLWARQERLDARVRLDRRAELAKKGVVNSISDFKGRYSGLPFRTSRDNPDHLHHAAATFEAYGLVRHANRIYPSPLHQTVWELGLPTPYLLLAHATILVRNHPVITSAFLEHLDLFDINGDQTGLVQTDAGWYLVGRKLRKGSKKAEQQILLSDESLSVILDVIEMTKPLRSLLKDQKNKLWRRLFLSITSMGASPKGWNPSACASHHVEWMSDRLQQVTGASSEIAGDLAKRFSLKRLRASAAVMIFLETGSVERMARALGHDEYRATLLDHYLPKPLQAFFSERWIRLFQTGLICVALKNSPFILLATDFATIEQLDEFLENHALRSMPSQLGIHDKQNNKQDPKQVIFGIEVGILTILISLQNAVAKASRAPCGRAVRWARIADRLIPHLETQTEQPEFVTMLMQARLHADSSKVEALIYG